MKKRLIAAATIGLGVISGCGNPAGLVPVSGKVLYRGEPATGAVVYFHRQSGPGEPARPIPYGVVEPDGSFSLTSEDVGRGAVPGSYSVLVEWRDRSGDGVSPVTTRGRRGLVKRSRVRSGPDRLEGRYFDVDRPRIHARIEAASSQLPPFELAD